jgi:hypothetical protein
MHSPAVKVATDTIESWEWKFQSWTWIADQMRQGAGRRLDEPIQADGEDDSGLATVRGGRFCDVKRGWSDGW